MKLVVTGTATVTGIGPALSETSNITNVTGIGTQTVEWDEAYLDDFSAGGVELQFSSGTILNGTWCSEADPATHAFTYAGAHGPDNRYWKAFSDWHKNSNFNVFRLMDLMRTNDNGTVPFTWAMRTTLNHGLFGSQHKSATLTVGSGNSALTFTGLCTIGSGSVGNGEIALYKSKLITGDGADGNFIKVAVNAPSGSGSVVWSNTITGDITTGPTGGFLTITVTPPAGTTTASAIANYIMTETTNYTGLILQVTAGGTGAGAVTPFAATALTGGAWAANSAGIAAEDIIFYANYCGFDPWLTLPTRATDNYISNFASTLANSTTGLLSSRRVYLESSNEIWNNLFAQTAAIFAGLGALIDGGLNPSTPPDIYDRRIGYASRWKQSITMFRTAFSSAPTSVRAVVTCVNPVDYPTMDTMLKPTASGGLGCAPYAYAGANAPYWGQIFTGGAGNWSSSTTYAAMTTVFDTTTGLPYFNPAMVNSGGAKPSNNSAWIELTAANIDPYIQANIASVTATTGQFASVEANYNGYGAGGNGTGSAVRHVCYENNWDFSNIGVSGSDISIIYDSAYAKSWQSYDLSELRRLVNPDTIGMFANFYEYQPTYFGISRGTWRTPDQEPAYAAVLDAQLGNYVGYWITAPSVSGYTGNPQVGVALTASVGIYQNAAGLPSVQWFRDGSSAVGTGAEISGAIATSYTPVTADVSHTLVPEFTFVSTNGAVVKARPTPTPIVIPVTKYKFQTSGSTFQLPADFNPAKPFTLHLWGEGGNGNVSNSGTGNGGGSGAWVPFTSATFASLTAGQNLSCQIGQGGSSTTTWLGSATTAKVDYGRNGTTTAGGVGGSLSNCLGNATDLGNGRAGSRGGNSNTGKAGGAGAPGPNGTGGQGGDTTGTGSAGGGGANGGSTPASWNQGWGEDGGNNRLGTDGGLGAHDAAPTNAATDGTNGGGGGGGSSVGADQYRGGGNGSADPIFKDSTSGLFGGPGGGGGGGGSGSDDPPFTYKPGNGGGWGGGGGGWANTFTSGHPAGGFGAPGAICLVYQP